MTRNSLALTVPLVALAVMGCGREAPEDPARAAEVDATVARYVEALGGLDNIRRIESLRKRGTYVYNGLEHPLTVLQKRGGRCREEIEGLTEYGTTTEPGMIVVRAYDGEKAWVGSQGVELESENMPAEQRPGFVLDADLEGPLVGFREKGHSVELAGPTVREGIDVLQLDLEFAGGQTQTWYLDSSTHLPVMKATDMEEGEFGAAQTWFLDDYREVEGVMMPFYVMVEENLFSREYILDEIEVNVSLDDALFARPPG